MIFKLVPATPMIYRKWWRGAVPLHHRQAPPNLYPGEEWTLPPPVTWSVDVAAYLLAGYDPEFGSFDWNWSGRDATSEHDRLMQIRFALGDAFNIGELVSTVEYDRRTTPQAYTEWAINVGVELPADWLGDRPTGSDRWPWGAHTTPLLQALEAAARRFWVNFDPDDISTAPRNEDVVAWLVVEHGLSKAKADAIAGILRLDGLRTGPR